MNVLEGSGGSEEVVDRGVESPRRPPVLPRPDLRVESSDVEQDGGLLEGDSSLTTWHSVQRIVPGKETILGSYPGSVRLKAVVVAQQ